MTSNDGKSAREAENHRTSSEFADAVALNLSRHYHPSQLRVDAWSRLEYAARELNHKHQRNTDTSILEQYISQLFEALTPIEGYWAFPGKEALKQLQELFHKEEYRPFSDAVSYLVHMLVSESYRRRATTLEPARLDGVGMSSYLSQMDEEDHSLTDWHYFEVLFVDNLAPSEERALRQRMREIADPHDKFVYDIVVVPSFEDALIAILFNHHLESCVVGYHIPFKSKNNLEILQPYLAEANDAIKGIGVEGEEATTLGPTLEVLKRLIPELDLYLLVDSGVEEIPSRVHRHFRRVFYRQENDIDLHMTIRNGVLERYETPFFSALREYSQRPTGVFHALPISRGNSIFNSHWIQDMAEFYGHNIFLAETSATTGGLDSLLQPVGPLKKAQEMAARAFGAQQTFFVTNGTSTANKIVVQALARPGDIVLVDRDCHKSHHYGLVLSGVYPVYLDSYPIKAYSMYGAVPLAEIKRTLLELKRAGRLNRVKMLSLTNCTFDGLVYNVERVMEEVLAIKPDMVFLWDEAWFGFAAFSPVYRQRTAMRTAACLRERYRSSEYRRRYQAFKRKFAKQDPADDATWLNNHLLPDPDAVKVRVYATQSTHKKLSSLRQGSMIHVYDEEFNRQVEDSFHEAYMTHTSTSPNYQILASLDIARRQVELEGFELVEKSIEMAMTLRTEIDEDPLLQRYFEVLTIRDLIPEEYRPSGIDRYYDPGTGWNSMGNAWQTDEFVLDPTHITLFVGKAGIDGNTFKSRYLMDQFGIQVNKTSRNTVLFMTSIGTTRSAVALLLSVLSKIARQLERAELAFGPFEKKIHAQRVKALTEDLPPLPDFSRFHERFRANPATSEGDIRAAYFMAYDEDLCEFLKLDGTLERALETGRELVSTSFVTPYPPGFPVLVPGQVISRQTLDFLKALDVKEIHGYRPELGMRVFTEAALGGPTTKPTVGAEVVAKSSETKEGER